jgi:hypothetical protein
VKSCLLLGTTTKADMLENSCIEYCKTCQVETQSGMNAQPCILSLRTWGFSSHPPTQHCRKENRAVLKHTTQNCQLHKEDNEAYFHYCFELLMEAFNFTFITVPINIIIIILLIHNIIIIILLITNFSIKIILN